MKKKSKTISNRRSKSEPINQTVQKIENIPNEGARNSRKYTQHKNQRKKNEKQNVPAKGKTN